MKHNSQRFQPQYQGSLQIATEEDLSIEIFGYCVCLKQSFYLPETQSYHHGGKKTSGCCCEGSIICVNENVIREIEGPPVIATFSGSPCSTYSWPYEEVELHNPSCVSLTSCNHLKMYSENGY